MATRTTSARVVREYLAALDADPLAATRDNVRRLCDRLITDGARAATVTL